MVDLTLDVVFSINRVNHPVIENNLIYNLTQPLIGHFKVIHDKLKSSKLIPLSIKLRLFAGKKYAFIFTCFHMI